MRKRFFGIFKSIIQASKHFLSIPKHSQANINQLINCRAPFRSLQSTNSLAKSIKSLFADLRAVRLAILPFDILSSKRIQLVKVAATWQKHLANYNKRDKSLVIWWQSLSALSSNYRAFSGAYGTTLMLLKLLKAGAKCLIAAEGASMI